MAHGSNLALFLKQSVVAQSSFIYFWSLASWHSRAGLLSCGTERKAWDVSAWAAGRAVRPNVAPDHVRGEPCGQLGVHPLSLCSTVLCGVACHSNGMSCLSVPFFKSGNSKPWGFVQLSRQSSFFVFTAAYYSKAGTCGTVFHDLTNGCFGCFQFFSFFFFFFFSTINNTATNVLL